jgi:septal ring factor EnvC (AmiA/AmiB activator)
MTSSLALDATKQIVTSQLTNQINTALGKKPSQGNLEGRKAVPMPFYLMIASAVIAVAATIAFAILASYAAAVVCGVAALSNLIGSIFVYRAAPTQEMADTVTRLEKINDELKSEIEKLKVSTQDLTGTINRYEKVNKELSQEVDKYEKELDKKTEALEKVVNKIVQYSAEHTKDKQRLRDNLDAITQFFKGNGEDTSELEQLKTTVEEINAQNVKLEQFGDFLQKQNEENQKIYQELSAVLKLLDTYGAGYDKDVKDLEGQVQKLNIQLLALQTINASLQANVKEDHEIIGTRQNQVNQLNDLLTRAEKLLPKN